MASGTAPITELRPRVLSTRSRWLGIGFAIAVALAWKYAEISPQLLFNRTTLHDVVHFVAQSLPPDLSLAFLGTVAQAAFLTVATAIASTVLSIVLGIPFGIMACSTLWRSGAVAASAGDGFHYQVLNLLSISTRSVLGFLRAVPDLMWALLLVAAVGLGPLAGTIALAISYTGVLGRVYADVFDAVEAQPVEALLSTGASRLQIFLTAIWPQALPNMTAYTLYSFECCVRAAAVLGFVGAGGIGYEINLSMRLFDYRQVTTLLLAFLLILSLTDLISRSLRRFLSGEWTPRPASFKMMASLDAQDLSVVEAKRSSTRWGVLAVLAAIFCAIVMSFYFSGFLGLVMQGALQIPQDLLHFAERLVPPDLSPDFLASLWLPVLQTLAISLLGTLIGVVLGGPLALFATSRLVLPPPGEPDQRPWVSLAVRRTVYWISRGVLSVLRSIPELVWALICIIAIGIGPFAGTLALGLHTTGVLGKLYADTMEEVRMQPVEALRALGASPLQLLLWAIWPQTKQLMASYTVLRWDMNLRAATILGLVGGGGLGQVMYNDVQLGFYPRVATLIVVIYGLVMATDWAGTRIWTAMPE
jgi:phosphonate transport system permease protein